jgi:exonuclease VII small subunit
MVIGVGAKIIKGLSKRAGQALKGGRKDAVVMREVVSGKGKIKQASSAAQRKREAEAKQAADLTQPAAKTPGKIAEQADEGLPAFQVAAKKASDFDKDLADAKKLVKKYTEQLKELKAPRAKDSVAKYTKRMEKIKSIETLLTQAKQKVADKKSRGGPGGKSKLTTAQRKVIGKKQGGSLKPVDQSKNPGLAKLPTPVRNKMGFAKKGGKISYRKGGGQALVASLYD